MLLSIITINLNNACGLIKTIESVIYQTFQDFEYIIIDGNSTDNSLEVINKYSKGISYWVSEPDKGIYNAMNKGIIKASGNYCLFLNSGDYLKNDLILENVFKIKPYADILYGNIESDNTTIKYPSEITLRTLFFGSLGHPASFIKLDLFHELGFYNEKNRIVSDWEFFVKAIIINKKTYQYLDTTISYFDANGISSSNKTKQLLKEERTKILKQYFPFAYKDYVNYLQLENEMIYYKNSRIIQFLIKIQKSNFYKKLRNIRSK